MGLFGNLIKKLFVCLLLLFTLGVESLTDALNSWRLGEGTITIQQAFIEGVKGGINKGFSLSANYIFGFMGYVSDKMMGSLILDGFMVLILFSFLFVGWWIPTDLLTGDKEDPLWIPAVLAGITLLGGSLYVANFGLL